MILYPNAKINLGLNILGKRNDDFHEIDTLMYPIGLTDIIRIEKEGCHSQGEIVLENFGLQVDSEPSDNIIVKAYKLLDNDFNLPSLRIKLQKNIPFGAGLGGGSADATFTLLGINAFCNLNLSGDKLEDYAAKLGSDCAFFVKNKAAFSRGRGELLSPYNIDLNTYQLVLIIPNVYVSTQTAYANIKAKRPEKSIEQIVTEIPVSLWKDYLVNDFETTVFEKHPEILKIKEKLYNSGALYASMSGSGSAVFGIFEKPITVDKLFPENYFVWTKNG